MSSNEQQQQKHHNGHSSTSTPSSSSKPSTSLSHSSINNGCSTTPMHHSCEICGETGFSDEQMLEHTQKYHVDNQIQCPFCGLTGASSAELLLHVNQAHLDYLTPENELMSFIDDSKTPSGGDDSDSMSCGMLSPSITEIPAGIAENASATHSSSNGGAVCLSNGKVQQHRDRVTAANLTKVLPNINIVAKINNNNNNNSDYDDDNNNNNNNDDDDDNDSNCDMANGANGIVGQNHHGDGSPLRSQLGLKLRAANKPKITVPSPSVPSPLVCLMCPYTTNDASILEAHINRSHFDPISPGMNNGSSSAAASSNHATTASTTTTESSFSCPICVRCFGNDLHALELHVNHEHSDILSPAKIDSSFASGGGSGNTISIATTTATTTKATTSTIGLQDEAACSPACPVCGIPFPPEMKTQEMELHIEAHFTKSPTVVDAAAAAAISPDLEKEARKAQEQREFEMLRAQYGMDDQGNFREQSAVAMQRAVYAGEMSVADYYCRQVGLRAAEQTGVDDCSSCTKSVVPRILNLSASSPGIIKSYVCSNVDHYAASYGDRGWGCGYRNAQMIISSICSNPMYNELLRAAIGSNSMPSISKIQKMIEAAWSQGFDEPGKEQLGCKLFETRKWIGATEIVTLFSWMRIECQLVDFHRPTALNGCHPELFNYVLRYFEQPRPHTPPLYLQHQGHSRTIVGIEQKTSGLTLLILDPSHSPKQVASLGTSQDSLRLLRRGPSAMKAPQYQIVSVVGKILTEEEYQASKIIHSLRIPPDR